MNVAVNKEKRLLSVTYPGIVENLDKALETLGGEEGITKTFADPGRRLELKWRPNDIYCKPAHADRNAVQKMLIKVKRKKRRKDTEEQNQSDEPFDIEILGMIEHEYEFTGMMDCQYLSMKKQEDGSYKSLRKELMPQKVEYLSWIKKDAELVLPPPVFSRMDMTHEYFYRDCPKAKDSTKQAWRTEVPAHIIGPTRARRTHHAVFLNYEDESVPTGPLPEAEENVKAKVKDTGQIEQLKKLFEERPIWSKNAIKTRVTLQGDALKFSLPVVAYYFMTGPWRSLWVRFGYDPRTKPEAKKFQLVDFRVRQRGAKDNLGIKSKRSTYNYTLPNQVTRTSKQPFNIETSVLESEGPAKEESRNKESEYRFRPGMVPPFRQMFYQLCDIEVQEIQDLVHKNDGKEEECSNANGWCIEGIADRCRSILTREIKKNIYRGKPLPHEAGYDTEEEESKKTSVPPVASTSAKDDEESMDYDDTEQDDQEDDDDDDPDYVNEMETEALEFLSNQNLPEGMIS